ncbi:dihydrofolate reductase family protein [Mucilaginibacter gilvus]|uniref:Dihydrofolate reductase n=1 Tax=Mucilaginibacter gilvus TaxID=2305909 RepID=A0A3S3VTT9_9SPHI|nr:dihydrofolate reductase family protein [Mucilaginibacter gilvus]RWY55737.1 dihydrofolate reductase [Mucilaginibacter gilvus]
MRKVIVSMNVTLNGCMAGRDGELDWHYSLWDEGMARATSAHLGEADTVLFGRITYQAMAGYWMAKGRDMFGAREDADFTEMINGYTKIVFSRTLKTTAWQNSRMAKNIAKEVTALKHQGGKDILVYGSGTIVAALNKLNLIDEYRLWVHPVVIHGGRALFKTSTALHFTGKTAFDTGVVLMSYKAGL